MTITRCTKSVLQYTGPIRFLVVLMATSLLVSPVVSAQPKAASADPMVINERFARLALACVHQEYPNKIAHVLNSDGDVKPPRELTPAFYGCYDWHSSVHGHWLLARSLATQPDTPLAPAIQAVLRQSLSNANIATEVDYIRGEGRSSFERPYGLAWFLQLVTELNELAESDGDNSSGAAQWRQTLQPLERVIVERIQSWLKTLAYPVRVGTHNQTAFAFSLILDYADSTSQHALAQALRAKAMTFYATDVDCPLSYEPSGEDFLSPCLAEADLMRRVLSPKEFSHWLSEFLPGIPEQADASWLQPGIVLDPSDGKLVHLLGLNISRAWALEGIASGLLSAGDGRINDARIVGLIAAANQHREQGLAAVSDEHYAGSHWLGSFAMYLTTGRGL